MKLLKLLKLLMMGEPLRSMNLGCPFCGASQGWRGQSENRRGGARWVFLKKYNFERVDPVRNGGEEGSGIAGNGDAQGGNSRGTLGV